MKKHLIVVLALVALGAVSVPVGARQQDPRRRGLSGSFSLMAMVHSSRLGGPGGGSTLVETRPWPITTPDGTFSYSAIPCRNPAPVNDISTNLTTYNSRVGRSPASTRSAPLAFRARETTRTGERGELSGLLRLIVCRRAPGTATDDVPDFQREQILFSWRARYEQTSVNEVRYSGGFRIVGGTGLYEHLHGNGTIEGYFMCLPAFTGPRGCDALGFFSDGQYTMHGHYRDPTVSAN